MFLLDNFRDESAITLSRAQAKLTEVPYLKFLRSHNLLEICEHLNERGNILLMKNPSQLEDSWIILDREVLLSKVNGAIFAPEGFKEHQEVATNTGVVLLSKLTDLFPNLNSNMIIQFLCHLEFCQEITDSEVLSLLLADNTVGSPAPNPGERYFFFPGLVHLDAPQDLWQPDEDSSYHSGWLLQCKPQQSFSLRFLHVLIHRLAFQFAFAFTPSEPSSVDHLALHRKCCIWDKGISWVDSHGGEAIVEITELKRLLVMTCCKREKLASVQLRSAIIHHVLNTKQELCPKVVVHESFIFPDDVVCYLSLIHI